MKIDSIVFDCVDAAPLARFWSAALGWSVAPYDEDELARLRDEGVTDPEDDPSVLVEPPEDSDLPTLFFTEVPEDKMVKNRVHLDLVADTAIEDDVERLRGARRHPAELGGGGRQRVGRHAGPRGQRVLRAPARGCSGSALGARTVRPCGRARRCRRS